MDDRQLIADLLSALEYHTEQTRPIEFSRVAIEAAREYLRKPAQQQEPVARVINKSIVWRPRDIAGLPTGSPLYTSPPANANAGKPWVGLTDEQILSLVPGLQDCLCDPWDYNNSGDYYASIPKDMIRLARAIEAAHGIKENT